MASNAATIALTQQGLLYVWGSNVNHDLGLPNTGNYLSPLQIAGNNWQTISTHSGVLASRKDGSLWGWGANNSGQLGTGLSPTRAATFLDIDFYTNYQMRIDSDSDGVPNHSEYRDGSLFDDSSSYLDSDGDYIPDYLDNGQYGNSPYIADAFDNDHDGFPDYFKIIAAQGDYDKDGIKNGWEISFGLNPVSNKDSMSDDDGDYRSNYMEYLSGTKPTDKHDFALMGIFIDGLEDGQVSLIVDGYQEIIVTAGQTKNLIKLDKIKLPIKVPSSNFGSTGKSILLP